MSLSGRDDGAEPAGSKPKASLLHRWWRSRPLAVQLGTVVIVVVGMVPGVLHIANREWTERRTNIAARQDELRRAELAATRLGTAMANMQSGDRGYLVTGDSTFLESYALGLTQLGEDVDSLERLLAGTRAGAGALPRYSDRMTEWVRLTAPVPAVGGGRRQSGVEQQRWAARVERDEAMMDSARVAHAALLAAIRQEAALQAREGLEEIAGFEEDARLIRLLSILVAFLLIVFVARVLSRTLRDIVRGADALASGDYEGARAASGLGGSQEARRLSQVFDRLALATAEREQIMRSDILQLKELETLKSEFVSTVSHELRTPLTAVRGALGLVLAGAAGPLTQKTTELLQIAQQNTHRLIRLINDILDIEKMESGHVSLRMEPCDLAGVLQSTLLGVRALADEARVRLRVNAPERPVVNGDPDRLVQVFTNLLSNAIKFTPPGREVRVQLSTSDSTAIVSFADQGPGIPEEFRERIFGKFQQAGQAETRTTGGTGLGLAIARAIVDMHGGTIRYESRAGSGSTFIVELPYAPARALTLVRSRADLPYVLVVEPEAATRDALAALFDPFVEVVAVRTSEEALSAVRQAAFDALVLDPDVAHGGTLELLRQLRDALGPRDLPMLLYANDEHSAAELAEVGLRRDDVFVKTVHSEGALVERLLTLTGRRAAAVAIDRD